MPDYIRPFGPTIYHGKFTEEEVDYLQQVSKDTLEENKRIGKSLVGIIKDHMEAEVKDVQKFLSILKPRNIFLVPRFNSFDAEKTVSKL